MPESVEAVQALPWTATPTRVTMNGFVKPKPRGEEAEGEGFEPRGACTPNGFRDEVDSACLSRFRRVRPVCAASRCGCGEANHRRSPEIRPPTRASASGPTNTAHTAACRSPRRPCVPSDGCLRWRVDSRQRGHDQLDVPRRVSLQRIRAAFASAFGLNRPVQARRLRADGLTKRKERRGGI